MIIQLIRSLGPGQMDITSQTTFLYQFRFKYENCRILIQNSGKLVLKGQTNHKLTLVQIMGWRRAGVYLLTYMCIYIYMYMVYMVYIYMVCCKNEEYFVIACVHERIPEYSIQILVRIFFVRRTLLSPPNDTRVSFHINMSIEFHDFKLNCWDTFEHQQLSRK